MGARLCRRCCAWVGEEDREQDRDQDIKHGGMRLAVCNLESAPAGSSILSSSLIAADWSDHMGSVANVRPVEHDVEQVLSVCSIAPLQVPADSSQLSSFASEHCVPPPAVPDLLPDCSLVSSDAPDDVLSPQANEHLVALPQAGDDVCQGLDDDAPLPKPSDLPDHLTPPLIQNPTAARPARRHKDNLRRQKREQTISRLKALQMPDLTASLCHWVLKLSHVNTHKHNMIENIQLCRVVNVKGWSKVKVFVNFDLFNSNGGALGLARCIQKSVELDKHRGGKVFHGKDNVRESAAKFLHLFALDHEDGETLLGDVQKFLLDGAQGSVEQVGWYDKGSILHNPYHLISTGDCGIVALTKSEHKKAESGKVCM